MKLVKQFFKEIKRLKDCERKATLFIEGVWPFGWSHECLPEDCFKRPDGLWEQYKKINTHIKGGETVIFLWRIDPNYCYYGQPVYTSERILAFRNNSETEKIILSQDDFEFVWRWSEIKMPTRTCWGMNMGETFYELRKGKQVLIQTPVKAEFIRQYTKLVERSII